MNVQPGIGIGMIVWSRNWYGGMGGTLILSVALLLFVSKAFISEKR